MPTLDASKQADVLLHLAALDDPLPDLERCAGRCQLYRKPHPHAGYTGLDTADSQAVAGGHHPVRFNHRDGVGQTDRAPTQRVALAFLRDHLGPVETTQVDASSATLATLEAKGYVHHCIETFPGLGYGLTIPPLLTESFLLSQLCHSFVTAFVIFIGYIVSAADGDDAYKGLRSRHNSAPDPRQASCESEASVMPATSPCVCWSITTTVPLPTKCKPMPST